MRSWSGQSLRTPRQRRASSCGGSRPGTVTLSAVQRKRLGARSAVARPAGTARQPPGLDHRSTGRASCRRRWRGAAIARAASRWSARSGYTGTTLRSPATLGDALGSRGTGQRSTSTRSVTLRRPLRVGLSLRSTVDGTRLVHVEPVYGTVIQAARLVWRLQGLKFTVTGVENLPVTGGAVIAINHTSYFDFTFAGLPAYQQGRGRKVRFMAKKEVFDNKVSGPIMRSLRHIPVDRDSGAASFEEACRQAQGGRAGRRLSRGDHQPQLRDQGVQVGRGADGDRRRRADRPAHRVGRPAHLDQGPPAKDVAAQGADLGRRRRADLPDAARRPS